MGLLESIVHAAPVVPVVVIRDVAHAVPLARALVAGGIPAIEVTLRTPAAREAARAMADVEGALVGVGTVLPVRAGCRLRRGFLAAGIADGRRQPGRDRSAGACSRAPVGRRSC